MKIAVIGSRGIEQLKLEEFLPKDVCEIITGGARGVDILSVEYARSHGIPLRVYPPDYHQYGRIAPLIRDRLIADECDMLFAFWDGKSSGTAYTVKYTRRLGKPVRLFRLKHRG